MAGNSIIRILPFLLILVACNSNEPKKEKRILPTDCSADTLLRDIIYTTTDLSNINEIIFEKYQKGSDFRKLINSDSYKINKVTRGGYWSFYCENLINVNYDYIFIIPTEKDSDYYYVTNMKLSYHKVAPYAYRCYLDYRVNYYNNSEQFILLNPSKIRNLAGSKH
jgi:hypothetical protein